MMGFVLAGGYGKRLLPLTSRTPKPFMQLLGRQMIDYSVELLREAGAGDIVVIVPPGMQNSVTNRGERIYVVEQRGADIMGALRTAYQELISRGGREAIISYTGFISDPPTMAKTALDFYSTSGFPIAISVASVGSGLETYGFVELDYRGAVTSFMRPRKTDKAWLRSRGYVFAGIMVTDANGLAETSSGPFEETMARLVSKGLVGGVVWPGKWVEVGYPWDVLEAIKVLLPSRGLRVSERANVSPLAVLGEGVIIDNEAVVEDGAVISGPAYIGRGAKVMSGAIVKPYTSIEEGATIGEGAVVANSVIMNGAQVGALSQVRSSVIGEGAIVEPGAHIIEGSPDKLPERLAWVSEYIGESVRLGAIVAPGASIRCCSVLGRGQVVES